MNKLGIFKIKKEVKQNGKKIRKNHTTEKTGKTEKRVFG